MKVKLTLFVCLFFLVSNTVFGQEVKKVKRSPPGTVFIEEYYVLKSAPATKHGPYKRTLQGKMVEEGFYKNGLKDSIWTAYSFKNNSIDYSGKIKNGKRIGIWEIYDENEILRKWFNYDTKQLIKYEYEPITNFNFDVKLNGSIVNLKLEQPPMGFQPEDIYSKPGYIIEYPKQALIKGTEGTVYISFYIDEHGKTSDYAVFKGIGDGCDEEALKSVKSMTSNIWLPGILNGRPIASKYIFPSTFTIK